MQSIIKNLAGHEGLGAAGSNEVVVESQSRVLERHTTRTKEMASHPQQNFYSQLEHLQSKYVGTGHPDTTKLYAKTITYLLTCFVSVLWYLFCGLETDGENASFGSCYAGVLCCLDYSLVVVSEWGVNQQRDSLSSYLVSGRLRKGVPTSPSSVQHQLG